MRNVRVRVESLPTRRVPLKDCPSAIRSAVLEAPFHPSAHTDRSTSLPSFTRFTPDRVMTAWVLVTWNICPLRLVRLPPVMVKAEVPLSASPLMD